MPQKILIIEDDKFVRDLITKLLTKEGFDVSIAVNGREGIEKLEKEPPDLVLLDLLLPGTDGFEILTMRKTNPELLKIPVIILSNLGQKEEIERGLELGAVNYLIKAHFSPREIVDKIKKVFE